MKASIQFCHFLLKENYKETRKLQKPYILCPCLETQSPPCSCSEPWSRMDLKGHLMLQMTQLMLGKNNWLAQDHTVSQGQSWGISTQCSIPSSQELCNPSFSWCYFICYFISMAWTRSLLSQKNWKQDTRWLLYFLVLRTLGGGGEGGRGKWKIDAVLWL